GRVNGPLEIVAVVDGVGRTGVHAEAAENAPAVIDLVDFGVAMILPDSLGVGARVFGAFDVDGVRRTGRRAEETRDAFLFAVFVDVQEMLAAKPAVNLHRLVRVLDRLFSSGDVAEGDAHSLRGGARHLDHFFSHVDDI